MSHRSSLSKCEMHHREGSPRAGTCTRRWYHPGVEHLTACGDSLPEKFEAAEAFYVVCCPKRKRPGKTFTGFETAVAKLPMPVLRSLATAIRRRMETVLAACWKVGGFIPLGCDGSRQNTPRCEELERWLG